MTDRSNLLTTKQMASFAAAGFLRFDALVPDELNQAAMRDLESRVPGAPAGTPLWQTYPTGSTMGQILRLPQIQGLIASLVGPEPLFDHHAIHVRQAEEARAQPLHADAIIDTRLPAFDIQLMYYPHDVPLEMGGTLLVPGSHLRRINESDIGRYQNLRGQTRLTCPAGTVVFLHHGIWHGGRRNDSDVKRYMFKIRFNPTVRQLRLWNTDDIDDAAVIKELSARFPWYENATSRLELVNRARLWRNLTGNDIADLDYYLTRMDIRPRAVAVGATDARLGGVGVHGGGNFR